MEPFKLDRSEERKCQIRKMAWDLREMQAGGPCIGCGYCCTKSPCGIFMMYNELLHVTSTTRWRGCPLLQWDGARHWCGLMLSKEGEERKKLMDLEHVGKGCCSSLNSWRKEPLQDRCVK